jgi:MoxR-like ATPase
MSTPVEPATLSPVAADLPPLDPEEFRRVAVAVEREVTAAIVGQEEAIRGTLISLVAGGHALLEGVPGLGKTSLVRAFGRALDLHHGRIQFTPDLMPADITGTSVLVEDASGRRSLAFQPGPIFANLILADEINRATPKTQSALLEAMQEGTVTVANAVRPLPQPFCVLATENPIEMQGTYPLPEAQLDRFFLKLHFVMPDQAQLIDIVYRTADLTEPPVTRVADAALLLRMRQLARSVPMARHVVEYATRLVLALQPGATHASEYVRRYVRLGASPRGAQALCLAGRVVALLDGRVNLAFADIRAMARPALRHRIVLSFDAQRQGVTPDAIIDEVLARVPEER